MIRRLIRLNSTIQMMNEKSFKRYLSYILSELFRNSSPKKEGM